MLSYPLTGWSKPCTTVTPASCATFLFSPLLGRKILLLLCFVCSKCRFVCVPKIAARVSNCTNDLNAISKHTYMVLEYVVAVNRDSLRKKKNRIKIWCQTFQPDSWSKPCTTGTKIVYQVTFVFFSSPQAPVWFQESIYTWFGWYYGESSPTIISANVAAVL